MPNRFRIPIRKPQRPLVRPWALSGPVAILLITLPLIRLQKPSELSDDEKSRMATVQAIVENGTLAIDDTREEFRNTADRVIVRKPAPGGQVTRTYSKQPPTMALLLAGPSWIMQRIGMSLDNRMDAGYIIYFLTVLTVTIPVALSAGFVYRMGRLFELPRPWRAGLGFATVCASGMVSYATVINSHALAASLVLAACACLFHVAMIARPSRAGAWLMVSGLCAALAAVIDMAAVIYLLLLAMVILTLRLPRPNRIGGVLFFAFGTTPALLLHCVLTIPVTGDVLPPFLHSEFAPRSISTAAAYDEDESPPSTLTVKFRQAANVTFGARGLFSHFPVVLIGLAGMAHVLSRHWPLTTKMLAVATMASAVTIIIAYLTASTDWNQPMFAVRWFVIFLPLLVFWAGAWLRKSHHPATWTIAALLLAFSLASSIVGAVNPFVNCPPGQYTAYIAARRLLASQPAAPPLRQTGGMRTTSGQN